MASNPKDSVDKEKKPEGGEEERREENGGGGGWVEAAGYGLSF